MMRTSHSWGRGAGRGVRLQGSFRSSCRVCGAAGGKVQGCVQAGNDSKRLPSHLIRPLQSLAAAQPQGCAGLRLCHDMSSPRH